MIDYEALFTNFHFLRPAWFYVGAIAFAVFLILKARSHRASNWEKSIDAKLLPFLLDDPQRQVTRNPFYLLLIVWLIAILALAGPVWEKTPQPVHEREDAIVVLLDLSLSMYATDVKPNRLIRARRKLLDLLKTRAEGVTGLVVYAGDAHMVSPLTDDADTIAAILPALTPEIMPEFGSELAPALQLAYQLFENGGAKSGRVLVITDEIQDLAASQNLARANSISYPISVLSVGTTEGAPISLDAIPGQSGYLKNSEGVLVYPTLDLAQLRAFAGYSGGRFVEMTLTDEDIEYLLAADSLLRGQFREIDRDFDTWREEGAWLVLAILPFAAFMFRRGWLWAIALLMLAPTQEVYALTWDDLWQTADQQGLEAFQEDDPGRAAQLFEHLGWKGAAHYRGGNYPAASEAFSQLGSADDIYNQGNALARQGALERAIEAYETAIAADNDHADAIFNKALVEKLLQQQQQQQDQNQDQEQSDREQQAQNQQDQEGGEQQDDSEPQGDDEKKGEQDEQQLAEDDDELDEEEKQALQQWKQRIPDNPGGLLKNKFRKQYEERLAAGQRPNDDPNAIW